MFELNYNVRKWFKRVLIPNIIPSHWLTKELVSWLRNVRIRAGNMARQLRALAVVVEDGSPIPSIHKVVHNLYNSSSKRV